MKKYTVISAILLVMLTSLVYAQEDMTSVDNRVFENPQRPSAVFFHDQHNEAAGIDDCSQCHHLYINGEKAQYESSEDQRCADCHSIKDNGKIPGLRKAYHSNCKGCHIQQQKGPIVCGDCHKN